jgi:hypothetical protein
VRWGIAPKGCVASGMDLDNRPATRSRHALIDTRIGSRRRKDKRLPPASAPPRHFLASLPGVSAPSPKRWQPAPVSTCLWIRGSPPPRRFAAPSDGCFRSILAVLVRTNRRRCRGALNPAVCIRVFLNRTHCTSPRRSMPTRHPPRVRCRRRPAAWQPDAPPGSFPGESSTDRAAGVAFQQLQHAAGSNGCVFEKSADGPPPRFHPLPFPAARAGSCLVGRDAVPSAGGKSYLRIRGCRRGRPPDTFADPVTRGRRRRQAASAPFLRSLRFPCFLCVRSVAFVVPAVPAIPQ